MAKKRKAKKARQGQEASRAGAPEEGRGAEAGRKAKAKSAKPSAGRQSEIRRPKRRAAKTKLPPRSAGAERSRPMTRPVPR